MSSRLERERDAAYARTEQDKLELNALWEQLRLFRIALTLIAERPFTAALDAKEMREIARSALESEEG